MPLIRFTGLGALLLVIASCALEPRYNQYQIPARQQQQAGQGAVAELQRSANEALQRQAFQQAIDYLQRAINIDPRNPQSWHYLAQVYWRSGDYRRCIEMVERSFSYSFGNDELDSANQRLKQQCLQG